MPAFWIFLFFDLLACHLSFPQQTEYSFYVSNQIYKVHVILLHCHTTFSPNIKVKNRQAMQFSTLTAAGHRHGSECTQIHTLVLFFRAKTGLSCECYFNGLRQPSFHVIIFKCLSLYCCQPRAPSHISLSPVSFRFVFLLLTWLT